MAREISEINSTQIGKREVSRTGTARLNEQYQPPMPQALQAIPEDIARKYNVIPLSLDGNTLRVCMSNPSDIIIYKVGWQHWFEFIRRCGNKR